MCLTPLVSRCLYERESVDAPHARSKLDSRNACSTPEHARRMESASSKSPWTNSTCGNWSASTLATSRVRSTSVYALNRQSFDDFATDSSSCSSDQYHNLMSLSTPDRDSYCLTRVIQNMLEPNSTIDQAAKSRRDTPRKQTCEADSSYGP